MAEKGDADKLQSNPSPSPPVYEVFEVPGHQDILPCRDRDGNVEGVVGCSRWKHPGLDVPPRQFARLIGHWMDDETTDQSLELLPNPRIRGCLDLPSMRSSWTWASSGRDEAERVGPRGVTRALAAPFVRECMQ